ncbi:MAG: hypothetical protein J7L54_04905, partial [Elusimicrobia bacterium]|nr:hypothetical protein [Elusimicrobiota bacterium]
MKACKKTVKRKKLAGIVPIILYMLMSVYPVFANLLPDTVDDRWHYGFESSALGVDDLCWEENDGGTTNNPSIDGYETVYRGSRSCRFVDLTTAYSGRTVISATVPVNASAGYYAASWVYVELAGGVINDVQIQIGIRWYDSSYSLIESTNSADLTLSAGDTWERLEFSTITAPSNVSYARIFIAAKESVNNNNDVVIDDAEFVESTPASSNNAPDAPNLAPSSSLIDDGWTSDDTPSFQFCITDPDGDNVTFEIQIATVSSFSPIVIDSAPANYSASGTTFTYTASPSLFDCATYYWRVKAIDANAAESAWTEAGTAGVIDFKVDATQPDAPTGLTDSGVDNYGQTQGNEDADGDGIAFSWNAVTDLSPITNYFIDISTESDFSTFVLQNYDNGTNTSYTLDNASRGLYYYFRVRAKNEAGLTSNNSSSDGIYIDKRTMNADTSDWSGEPATSSNTAVVSNYEGIWTDTSPARDSDLGRDLLEWRVIADKYNLYVLMKFSAFPDAVDDAIFAQIAIDNDTTSSEKTFIGRGVASADTDVCDDVPWERLWKILSYNDLADACDSSYGDWRSGKYTEHVDNKFIEASIKLSDLDGASKFLGQTVNFTVAIFKNNDGNVNVWGDDTNSDVVDCITGADSTWTEIEDKVINYYLQVSFDSGGDVTSFLLKETNHAPNAPSLTSPENNTVDLDPEQTFKWTFSDPDADDTQSAYEWQADDDSGFGSVNFDSGKVASSYSSHTVTLSEGVWYWRVKTWDALDAAGPYSAGWKITIDTTPPSDISDLTALRAADGTANIELNWTDSTDGTSGVKEYKIDRCRGADAPITNANAGDGTHPLIATVTTSSHTDTTASVDTQYTYAVEVIDNAGNDSNVSNNVTIKSASRKIDGDASDWGTSEPAEPDASTVDTTKNEWIWKDVAVDERTDTAYDSDVNITEMRVAADSDALYFLVKFENITDTKYPYLAIGVDSTLDASGQNWIADDSGITIGSDYDTNNHLPENNLIVHHTNSGSVTQIEQYSGTSWAAPATYGGGCNNISTVNDIIEFKIARSDVGLTGDTTGRFTIAICLNSNTDDSGDGQWWANDDDTTEDQNDCDALDSVSIVRFSDASNTYNDNTYTMTTNAKEGFGSGTGDIDFFFDIHIAADGTISNAPPTAPSNLSPDNQWVDTLVPTLSWTAASDSDDAVTSYLVEVATHTDLSGDVTYRVNVNATNWAIPANLANGTTYYWRVSARDRCGVLTASAQAKFFTDDTAPSQVVNFAASAAGTTVSLNWDDAVDNESGIAGYDLFRATYTGFTYTDNSYRINTSTAITTSDYSDTGLTRGLTYYYRVKAVNNAGTQGVASDETSVWVPPNYNPNSPSSLGPSALISGGWINDSAPTFQFTQSDPDDSDTVQFNLIVSKNADYSSPVLDYTSALGPQCATNYTLSLPSDGTYYWKVKTIDENSAESGWSEAGTPAFKLDTVAPDSVTDLAATSAGFNIDLAWTPATDALSGVDHQVIYRATFTITESNKNSSNVSIITNSLSAGVGNYTDANVVYGTTYYYVVTAVDNAANEAAVSNCDSATPTTAPRRLPYTNTYCEPIFTPGEYNSDLGYDPYMNVKIYDFIMAAQSELLVCIYNLTDDDGSKNITDALIYKSTSGVTVEVITDGDNNDTTAIQSLVSAGITVKDDGTDSDCMHNKFIVRDDKYVWTGSANWTTGSSLYPGGMDRQYNDGIFIYNEDIAAAYKNKFNDLWAGNYHTNTNRGGSANANGNTVEYYFTGEDALEDTASYGLRYKAQNAQESYIAAIDKFVGSVDDDYPGLEDDIVTLRNSGKIVRIVFDRHDGEPGTTSPYANASDLGMDDKGMNVRLLGDGSLSVPTLHSKLAVIDQEIIATGSMNWTHSANTNNDENELFIHDPIVARQYVRYIMRLYGKTSDEDTLESPSPDETPPSSVSDVYAFGSGSGQITVDFTASSDEDFSRYYIFISSIPVGYADAMTVKSTFSATGQTHLSDASDNDEDGRIDEEIFNGVDDDGDGKIDEDINLLAEKVITTKGSGSVQIVLTTFAQGEPLDNNTTYWVCVLQTDKWGNESAADFSDATEPSVGDSFYGGVCPSAIVNEPPYCSVNTPSGWQGGTFDISAFGWDNDGDDVTVEFEYSTSSESGPWFYIGSESVGSPSNSSGTFTHSWASADDITSDGTVWIRARSKDSNYAYSDWSVSDSFGVDNVAPSPKPVPDDGIDASGTNWTNSNSITMVWGTSSDSGAGLQDYVYHYDTNSDASTTDTSYNTILSDGHHTFYVAARDNVGNTSAYGEHYVNVDVTKPASTT